MADRFVQRGIETWVEEGHIDQAEATRLRVASNTPEVASALTHLGAHIAITVPLRFPLGSIARAGWTVVMRTQAEWRALFNKKYSAASARQEHTALVAGVSLIPGLGAAAYMLSKPLRSNRELAVIAFDHMLRKTPFRLYQRLHVSALTVWQAKQGAEVARTSLRQATRGPDLDAAAARECHRRRHRASTSRSSRRGASFTSVTTRGCSSTRRT